MFFMLCWNGWKQGKEGRKEMKIVIDISKHIYEHAKEQSEDSNDEWDAMRAIATGTPLEYINGLLNDIHSLWDNYKKPEPYFPEYLEEDFARIMKKWEERMKRNGDN